MAFCDLFKEFIPIRVDDDIYLRQHEPEKDARPFWEIYYDEENFLYFGGYRKPHDWNEEGEIRVQQSRIKGFNGKREYSWVVTYQGKVIGQIQLFNFFNHNTCAEVGYFIKKSYWNRGINTKVLKAVCRFGIETMGLERIEAFAHVDNIGSNRTLQKAGFTKEGTLRKRFEVKGELFDCNVYSFVKDDFKINPITGQETPKILAETADKQFSIVSHYNTLIDENNDPVHDPKPLRDYMDKWDGPEFIEKMCLDENKSVLEVGVGTGRLAIRVAPLCGEFCGIDISPKTIERAQENLAGERNVLLICEDFLSYKFNRPFDVVYSSLTLMHIEDKQKAINKIAGLLNIAGRLVLSIDKNPSDYIDNGMRKIKIYPDKPDATAGYIRAAGLTILDQYDTEFATVFVARKG